MLSLMYYHVLLLSKARIGHKIDLLVSPLFSTWLCLAKTKSFKWFFACYCWCHWEETELNTCNDFPLFSYIQIPSLSFNYFHSQMK
ncbi:hypothetical protein Bca4012_101323 [Brassica carinata]